MGVRRLVFKGDDVGSTGKYATKSFGVDRKLVDRLKRRATLAKKIANSTVEKVKKNREDDELGRRRMGWASNMIFGSSTQRRRAKTDEEANRKGKRRQVSK
jgi:ATP-dependent RNA helicase DDX24/MAK5